MNLPEHVIVRPPRHGRRIGVVGDAYRFLATGQETGGRYAMFEATVPPGGGPPLHVHTREVESFFVLEGEVTFQVGAQSFVAVPGTFANMPIGSEHAFKNAADRTAKMLISLAPAGLEDLFFQIGQPLADGESPAPPSPEDIERLLAAAPQFGIEIKLPPR